MPKSNRKFWAEKLKKNRSRDDTVNQELKNLGWRVLRIWEHETLDVLRQCAEEAGDVEFWNYGGDGYEVCEVLRELIGDAG